MNASAADTIKQRAESAILGQLVKEGAIESSTDFAEGVQIPNAEMTSVMQSLLSDSFVVYETRDSEVWELTAEGEAYAEKGMPEVQLYHAIPDSGLPLADVNATCTKLGIEMKVAQGALMKAKWATTDKAAGVIKRLVDPSQVVDKTSQLLKGVKANPGQKPEGDKELKKRKLITTRKVKDLINIKKGPLFAPVRKKAATDITADMLKDGSWQSEKFKDYNLDSLGIPPGGGTLHPLLKVRKEFREIFLELGFEEMPSNKWVESSFWNFDSLFQPQQHPARDAHDTFFLKNPESSEQIPRDYLERVRDVHQTGGYGSAGYGYEWSEEESRKNVLRTHTTAVSSRMLYRLAQEYKETGVFTPKKYFSIDRVFRNEALDRTHLAEFHQIEGVVCDRGITLGDLIGTIQQFFVKIGIPDVSFKPAFNPYTEPSMEIFGWSPELNKLIELGNSGMFRPEMLEPMGLPEDVRVIAWGIALERPTMIMYKFGNIRDLFGHGVDLKMIGENAMCNLCKEEMDDLHTM